MNETIPLETSFLSVYLTFYDLMIEMSVITYTADILFIVNNLTIDIRKHMNKHVTLYQRSIQAAEKTLDDDRI